MCGCLPVHWRRPLYRPPMTSLAEPRQLALATPRYPTARGTGPLPHNARTGLAAARRAHSRCPARTESFCPCRRAKREPSRRFCFATGRSYSARSWRRQKPEPSKVHAYADAAALHAMFSPKQTQIPAWHSREDSPRKRSLFPGSARRAKRLGHILFGPLRCRGRVSGSSISCFHFGRNQGQRRQVLSNARMICKRPVSNKFGIACKLLDSSKQSSTAPAVTIELFLRLRRYIP